jgi:putative transposase
MRYPKGGGLTAERRVRRETVRLQAAEMFAHRVAQTEVTQPLRVSQMSGNRWFRAWQAHSTMLVRLRTSLT